MDMMEFDNYSTWNWGMVALLVIAATIGFVRKYQGQPCERSEGLFDYLFKE